MTTTLIEYTSEIGPKIRKLNELNEALKEWKAGDNYVQGVLEEIKRLRADMKGYAEDKEGNLLREINDLKTDIKLAVEAAVDGTDIAAKDFRSYLVARASEKVELVVAKGELFTELESQLGQ